MERHSTDWVSLIFGAVFAAIGVFYLFGDAARIRLDGRWVLPVVLIAVGVAILASSWNAVTGRPESESERSPD